MTIRFTRLKPMLEFGMQISWVLLICIGKRERGGRPFEAFWKLSSGGDEFLSVGPRYNWFSTQWLTGATFNTLSSRRMEMYPKVQLLLKISTVSPFTLGKLRSLGAGAPHLSANCLNVLTEAPVPYCPSHSENWALAFLFPVARCWKHLFSDLDHKVREELRASPPWNTY